MGKVAKYVRNRIRKELKPTSGRVDVVLTRTMLGAERVKVVFEDRGVTATAAIEVDGKSVIGRDLNVNISRAASQLMGVLESAIERKIAERVSQEQISGGK